MASKKDIADIKSSIQQINVAISEIRDSVIKALINENTLLKTRVHKLEVELAENSQYLRRTNIVISGIPSLNNDVGIESTVIDVPVKSRDIAAVHRIGKHKEETMVRFVNRKDAELAIKNRSKLKDFDATLIGSVEATDIYVKENYCPFLQKIGFMCKKLKRAHLIFLTWMLNGRVNIKVKERDKSIIVNHPDELYSTYPDFDFS